MSIDEEYVGRASQLGDDFLDRGEFAEREIGRDVREVHVDCPFADVEHFEAFGIEDHRGSEGTVAYIGHVDAAERSHMARPVGLLHVPRESHLLCAELCEKGDGLQPIDETVRFHLGGGPRSGLNRSLARAQRQHRTTVRANDSPRRIELRMFPNSFGHGPRGTDVPQGARNRSAGSHLARGDALDARRECVLERDGHDSGNAPRPQNLSSNRSMVRDRMSLLLKNGLVVTQDSTRRVVQGDVLVEGDRIVAIGGPARDADEVLDCSGCAVVPGLINLHQHAANTLLRGLADDVALEDLLKKAFAVDARITRRDVQIGALLGCLEMIRSGTTSFQDLFYWEDEVARAVRECGIRGFLSWVTLDTAFTTQHGDPVRNADAFVTKHLGDPLVTPSVGVQGVYVASEETFLRARDVAIRHGVRLHAHLSETRKEVYDHVSKTGLRPTEWLEKIDFLGPRLNVAHGVWLTLNEVRILARHGVSVAHCPVSNMKLASGGVAPVPEMLQEGVCVGLGTDSALSNNSADLFSEMKTASLLQKATRWDARILPAQAVLDMVTIEAAKALGVDDRIGSVEVGKRADLAVVALRRPHTTPFYPANVISHLVYSSRGSDVQTTIVDGRVLMAGGVVRTVDEDAVLERAQETARELLEA